MSESDEAFRQRVVSIMRQHAGTDKSDKALYHAYEELYPDMLCELRAREPLNILEVGVANGHSLLIWSEILPHANIYGWDWNHANITVDLEQHPSITLLPPASQTDAAQVEFFKKAGIQLHLVIDDASHKAADFVKTFRLLRPHLAPDAAYVIEDVDPRQEELLSFGFTRRFQRVDLREKKGRHDDIVYLYRHRTLRPRSAAHVVEDSQRAAKHLSAAVEHAVDAGKLQWRRRADRSIARAAWIATWVAARSAPDSRRATGDVGAVLFMRKEGEQAVRAGRSYLKHYAAGTIVLNGDDPFSAMVAADRLEMPYLTGPSYVDRLHELERMPGTVWTGKLCFEVVSIYFDRLLASLRTLSTEYVLILHPDHRVRRKFVIPEGLDFDFNTTNPLGEDVLRWMSRHCDRPFPFEGYGLSSICRRSAVITALEYFYTHEQQIQDLGDVEPLVRYGDDFLLPLLVHLSGGRVSCSNLTTECNRDSSWRWRTTPLLHQVLPGYDRPVDELLVPVVDLLRNTGQRLSEQR
jgi:hypothetical protein